MWLFSLFFYLFIYLFIFRLLLNFIYSLFLFIFRLLLNFIYLLFLFIFRLLLNFIYLFIIFVLIYLFIFRFLLKYIYLLIYNLFIMNDLLDDNFYCYWCMYRHLWILPERFGKKDLWITNLIIVYRKKRRNVITSWRRVVVMSHTSGLYDYPFNYYWCVLEK